jgi:hypothetical protein
LALLLLASIAAVLMSLREDDDEGEAAERGASIWMILKAFCAPVG